MKSRSFWMQSCLALITASASVAMSTAVWSSTHNIVATNVPYAPEPLSVDAAPAALSRVLIVVDAQVDDYDSLLSELQRDYEHARTDVLTLTPDSDGVQQITAFLRSASHSYSSVHVFSHGTAGAVELGNVALSTSTFQRYQTALANWSEALTEQADILFYGCEVTATEEGVELVRSISQVTGADIAASSTLTGNFTKNGDWMLETRIGRLESAVFAAPDWDGALAKLIINPVDYPIRESDGQVSGEPDVVTGLSLPFGVGDSALWSNAGTADGQIIDVRATVVSFNDTSGSASGAVSFSTNGDDLWLQVFGGQAEILWEVFLSGGGQTTSVTGNPVFIISDIDGNGSGSVFPALQVEAVRPEIASLTSYTLDTPTNLETGTIGNDLYVRGTQTENGGQTSLVRFNWNSVSSWTITYEVSNDGARYFMHDGDGDLSFVIPSTTSFLRLDLDADDSSVTGDNFVSAVFDESGTAVALVDSDPQITFAAPLNNTFNGAQVSITNSYPEDELLVDGSDSAAGTITVGGTVFNYTNTGTSAPAVSITGTGTAAEYETALKSLSFRNQSTELYGDTREIGFSVTDDEQSTTSNVAFAIVNINPDLDGDSYLNDVDLDDDNDGVLDTAESAAGPMVDVDADGFPAYLDDDDSDASVGNDNGVPEADFDPDGDGVANHFDLDSDNDGLPDNIEAQSSSGYLPPNRAYDGFGVDTAYAGGLDRPVNLDGDALDDFLDSDSDADGISDTTEAGLDLNIFGFGVNGLDDDYEEGDDYSDPNGSFSAAPIGGLPDADNPGGEPDWRDPQDFDEDTFASNVDIDDDGDGITDANETGVVDTSDFDHGDLTLSGIWREDSFYASGFLGVIATEGDDYLLAANSDVGLGDTFGTASGLLDTADWVAGEFEFSIDVLFPSLGASQLADFTVTVFSGLNKVGELTGVAPGLDGSSVYALRVHLSESQLAWGISIEIEVPNTGANALVVLDNLDVVGNFDFDNDGVADSHDLDSDNDGIPDNVEAQSTFGYVAPEYADDDNDGLDNNYEFEGNEGLYRPNTDGTGNADYLDVDSDDDGLSDTKEAGLYLGVINVGRNGWDNDAEAADDYVTVSGTFAPPATALPDADGDATSGGDVDFRETDSDGDGLSDSDEDLSEPDPLPVGDTNANDVDDSIDVAFTDGQDRNGNGIDDTFELTDSDGDGFPNYADQDSDNDGILDSVEGLADSDGDSFADLIDLDSDNDGLPDNVEAQTTEGYISPATDDGHPSGWSFTATGVNTAYASGLTPVNTDGSDTPDYKDADADNDGTSDADESGLSLGSINVGLNGLDNNAEVVDDYSDVNGIVVDGLQTPSTLPNSSGTGDVDYRSLSQPTVNLLVTTSSTPVLSGTHDSDALLSVAVGGATYTAGDGVLIDGGDNSWSLTVPTPLTDGTYDVDASSILGPLSASDQTSGELVIDSELPSITATSLGPINDPAPALSGTTSADVGLTVTVTDSVNALVCSATVEFSDPNFWSCNVEGGLAEGVSTLTASVSTAAGATASATFTVEVDVTDPELTAHARGLSFDARPELDGTTSEQPGTPVVVTDVDGATVCATTVVPGESTNLWSCVPTFDLPDGESVLTVTVTDEAGNTVSVTVSVEVNTVAPLVSISAIAGDDVIDGIEIQGDLVVTGTTSNIESAPILVSANGQNYTTTANAVGGDWSVTIPAADVKQFAVSETITATVQGGVGTNAEPAERSVTRDADVDGDGIPDLWEAGASLATPADSDDDGIFNYRDLDSDGDGIPDGLENTTQSGTDTDADGIDDRFEANLTEGLDADGDGLIDEVVLTDSDGDGVPDFIDTDSDNDSLADAFEYGVAYVLTGFDSNGNGIDDGVDVALTGGLDTNGNGVDDASEPKDSDADGLADYLDLDADNDGVGDVLEGVTDTDGDSVADFRDLDSDGDGVLDLVEYAVSASAANSDADSDGIDDAFDADLVGSDLNGNGIDDAAEPVDTDRDGFPDALDIDADGDGVADVFEAQSSAGYLAPTGVDLDVDGLDDAYDADTSSPNADTSLGLTPVNTDGQAGPDILSLDSDGDGVADSSEAWGALETTFADADADGLEDAYDLYDNVASPDRVANVTNGAQVPQNFSGWRQGIDSDGDGTPDYADTDDDNDGIPDSVENANVPAPLGTDVDGDDIDDSVDVDQTGGVDANQNGVDDAFEPVDTDGDGTPDGVDRDADNDGIIDRLEFGDNPSVPKDTDGDGIPDFLDTDADNDGVPDRLENAFGPVLSGNDTDGDGIDDAVDVDQTLGQDLDGDGVDDAFAPADSDADGVPDHLDVDSDNDGIPDVIEFGPLPTASGQDSDGDGIDDAFDVNSTGGVDADANGVDDLTQPADTNRDGIPDFLATDSDSDGIADRFEADSDFADSDGDGILNFYDITVTGGVDANFDGVDDAVEATDTDGDSIPDYLDLDSDNDGVNDVIEAGLADSNGDGIVDSGIETSTPLNTDGDDFPDFRDLDSDNDSISDVIEAGLAWLDVDGNGVIDDTGDIDGDGVPDSVDSQPGSFAAGRDFDGDGSVDLIDLDADNDGIADAIEAPNGDRSVDTDSDGIPDYLDLDSDNDGLSDLLESQPGVIDANGDGQIDQMVDANSDGIDDRIASGFVPADEDGDGFAAFIDLDTDGDGIFDLVESGASGVLDTNKDGMIDRFELDDLDFDGLIDAIDSSVAGGTPGQPIVPVDTDQDGTPDYKDLDSDDDDVSDQMESGDIDEDGVPDRLQKPATTEPPQNPTPEPPAVSPPDTPPVAPPVSQPLPPPVSQPELPSESPVVTPPAASSAGGGGSLGTMTFALLLLAAIRARRGRQRTELQRIRANV